MISRKIRFLTTKFTDVKENLKIQSIPVNSGEFRLILVNSNRQPAGRGAAGRPAGRAAVRRPAERPGRWADLPTAGR